MQISLRVMNEKHELVMCAKYLCENAAHEAFNLMSDKLKGSSSYPALVFDFIEEDNLKRKKRNESAQDNKQSIRGL